MRGRLFLAAAMVLATSVAGRAWAADEEIKPEELRKLYQDTLSQLTAAQNRKAELAAENEKLTARVTELEKQLKTAQSDVAELQYQATDYQERTFYLRASQSAWQTFIQIDPEAWRRWQLFVHAPLLALPYDLEAFEGSGTAPLMPTTRR
jgi:TolA-binding protein